MIVYWQDIAQLTGLSQSSSYEYLNRIRARFKMAKKESVTITDLMNFTKKFTIQEIKEAMYLNDTKGDSNRRVNFNSESQQD